MEKPIAEIVRFHRKQSGLSRKQLADMAGVGKTVIFDIENEKETIRFSTLKKVLTALNIKINLESPLMERMHEES
ncbi:MAG: helix-turn-helix transcriptional regulator [Deltaproteobacteria bacterium]|jgi:ribosome-binding protein aMBF1 (putative translation factor)|nr:helix-turn-helix transcriptional regulator [Deltaproteobacteria bacterium]MBW2203971.1 helix-turn-helix transcriptional regulator [Deltaproteobacteria bacterium]MCJ7686292.1 helix-turn-helix domain-containing protein [Desulfobacteraceae bacterium]